MASLDNRLSWSCTATQMGTVGVHQRGFALRFKSCLCMVSIRRVNQPSFNFLPVNAVIVSQMKATILRALRDFHRFSHMNKKQMLRGGLSRK